MTPLRTVCCLLAVTLLSAGCTEIEPGPPQPVVLGVLAAGADRGERAADDAVLGAQLAVDVVNEAHADLPVPLAAETGIPSLRGAKLVLVRGDTGSAVETAEARSAALVAERRAVGVVLADTAEIAAATASTMQRLRVPLIDARSTADYLTELGLDWYFRTGPSDRSLVETSLGLLRQRHVQTVAPKIAVVVDSGSEGLAAATRIHDAVTRDGGTVVVRRELSPGGRDASRPVPVVDADAVFAWARTAAGATALVRAAQWVAPSAPVFGLGPGFRLMGPPPAGSVSLLRPMPWSTEYAQRSPAGQAVIALFERRFGRPMTSYAADAFTATIALAVAIESAGSSDPAAIRTALRQTSLTGPQMIMPWSGLRFGADGQNQLAAAVVEQWTDDAYRLVFPAELASVPMRWGARSGR